MFTVIQTDRGASDRIVEDAVFAGSGLDISFVRLELDSEEGVIEECAAADALIPAYVPLTARVLDALPSCRIIAFMATGFNSVDMAAATERGIVVTNVPDYCTAEVADHALGFLLDLGRNISRLHDSVLAGAWDYEACGKPGRIGDQSLGIIGLGRIGSAVARRAAGFGLAVKASDPYVDEATMNALGVQKASLDEVLACDYVSLHCALNDETRGIIGAGALARMKPGAFLVNTARGTCVDTQALTAALQAGAIAGAALDVVSPEPLPAGHPLSPRSSSATICASRPWPRADHEAPRARGTAIRLQPLEARHLDVEELGDVTLRFDALAGPGHGRDDADVELFAQGAHHCRIGEVVQADLELVGHVLFGLRKPHLLAELHPRHQISSGADAPHAGGKRVAHRHPIGIAGAHLQAVDAADLDHRRAAPGEHVGRRHLEHRHAADAHADVGVDGDLGDPAALLDEGHGAGHVPRGAPS